jgi:hypothetical protein
MYRCTVDARQTVPGDPRGTAQFQGTLAILWDGGIAVDSFSWKWETNIFVSEKSIAR